MHIHTRLTFEVDFCMYAGKGFLNSSMQNEVLRQETDLCAVTEKISDIVICISRGLLRIGVGDNQWELLCKWQLFIYILQNI